VRGGLEKGNVGGVGGGVDELVTQREEKPEENIVGERNMPLKRRGTGMGKEQSREQIGESDNL